MRIGLYVLVSLMFGFGVYSVVWAGSLSVTVTPHQYVIDVGRNTIVSASVTGGSGLYTCNWAYYPNSRAPPTYPEFPFANQSCTVIFNGNVSDLASPDAIIATVNDIAGDTGSGSAFVAVKPALMLRITASSNTVSEGNSITISNTTGNSTVAYSGEPPYTYSYIVPNGVVEQGNSFTFPNPGTYKITEVVEDSTQNTAYSSINVTVTAFTQPLSVSISSPVNTFEVGQSATVYAQASGGTPPYSYAWFVNGVQNATASSNTFALSPAAAGLYTVYANAIDTSGETQASQALGFNVIPAVTVSVSANRSLISAGQKVLFSNTTSGGAGPYTYAYALNDTAGVTQSGNVFTFSSSGNYLVTLEATDTLGVSSNAVARITVTPQLQVILAANRTYISAGQSVRLSNATEWGTGSNQWSYSVDNANGIVEGSGADANVFSFAYPGNYVMGIEVTDASGEVASSNVLIAVAPQLTVALSANVTSISAGQKVLFSNATAGGTGGSAYAYTVNSITGVVQAGNVFEFSSAGNFIVTLTVSDASGETAASSVAITVLAQASCRNPDSVGDFHGYKGEGKNSDDHQGNGNSWDHGNRENDSAGCCSRGIPGNFVNNGGWQGRGAWFRWGGSTAGAPPFNGYKLNSDDSEGMRQGRWSYNHGTGAGGLG